MIKRIKHIWKYLTNTEYRFNLYLKRLNKKYLKKDE